MRALLTNKTLMKVLFKKHVVNVGHPGDIKEVKTGYALNCLLPQGLAIQATPAILQKQKESLKKEDAHNREMIEERHNMSEALNGKKISFTLQTTPAGKVYGGIGEKEIIDAIKKAYKITITKKHISLPDGHIKKIGESFIYIKFWKDAMAKVTAVVSTK